MITKNARSGTKKIIYTAGTLLVLSGIVILSLQVTGITHLFTSTSKKTATTASEQTKGETNKATSSASSKDDTSPNLSQPGDAKSNTTGSASTTTLLAPTGDFISNHRPNLSGNPAPNTITSVCTTTPGASCVISFTKDGVTESLSSEVTDRGGSAYWNWKLQDIDLSEGVWHVTAIASMNGQRKSSLDALDLVVSQ